MRFQASFDTKASPDQVLAAFTDFSDKRTDIWKGTLDPDKFEVYEVGENTARVREGSKRPNVWAIENYDWAEPGRVSWVVEESNFCKPGSGIEATIAEGANGGSHIDLTWDRTPSNLKGWMLVAPMKLVGPSMIGKSLRGALDRYAEASSD